MNESQFLKTLQDKAQDQAKLSASSPLPEWAKPIASIVGLHYWQVLLAVSCVLAIFLSVASFPYVYSGFIGF